MHAFLLAWQTLDVDVQMDQPLRNGVNKAYRGKPENVQFKKEEEALSSNETSNSIPYYEELSMYWESARATHVKYGFGIKIICSLHFLLQSLLEILKQVSTYKSE